MNPFVRKETPASRNYRFKTANTRNKRSRVFLLPETLEDRRLLAATLDLTAGGALTYNGSAVDNNTTISDTSTSGAGDYVFSDTGETITLTPAAILAGWTGDGTNTVTGPDSSVTSLLVNVDSGNDTVNVQSITDPISVDTGLGVP